MMDSLIDLWQSTGLYQIQWDQAAMIVIGLLLLYLAIVKKFEPLLLVPIGFGGILANTPGVDIAVGDGILYQLYSMGIFSRCDTSRNCTISIFRSASVVSARIIGG